jgi:hypothetical protein
VTGSGNPQFSKIRGEGLRIHLASHGIAATVHPGEEGPLERVQFTGNLNAEDVQAIIDEWEH